MEGKVTEVAEVLTPGVHAPPAAIRITLEICRWVKIFHTEAVTHQTTVKTEHNPNEAEVCSILTTIQPSVKNSCSAI